MFCKDLQQWLQDEGRQEGLGSARFEVPEGHCRRDVEWVVGSESEKTGPPS